jgi:hypothetical protein
MIIGSTKPFWVDRMNVRLSRFPAQRGPFCDQGVACMPCILSATISRHQPLAVLALLRSEALPCHYPHAIIKTQGVVQSTSALETHGIV